MLATHTFYSQVAQGSRSGSLDFDVRAFEKEKDGFKGCPVHGAGF